MRVTLDTNILVRAVANQTGPARRLVEILTLPPNVLVLSDAFFDELNRVLRYPRLQAMHQLDNSKIESEVEAIRNLAEIINVPAMGSPRVVGLDRDDDVVVATAVTGNADVLCTLDRHLRQPDVLAYCLQHSVSALSDIELLRELRTGNVEPTAT